MISAYLTSVHILTLAFKATVYQNLSRKYFIIIFCTSFHLPNDKIPRFLVCASRILEIKVDDLKKMARVRL